MFKFIVAMLSVNVRNNILRYMYVLSFDGSPQAVAGQPGLSGALVQANVFGFVVVRVWLVPMRQHRRGPDSSEAAETHLVIWWPTKRRALAVTSRQTSAVAAIVVWVATIME